MGEIDILTRFRNSCSPFHSYLPFLIADYNLSCIDTITNFKGFFEKTRTYDVTQNVLMGASLKKSSSLMNNLGINLFKGVHEWTF